MMQQKCTRYVTKNYLYSKRSSFRILDREQPQGIAPTISNVGAILYSCPIIQKLERLKYILSTFYFYPYQIRKKVFIAANHFFKGHGSNQGNT